MIYLILYIISGFTTVFAENEEYRMLMYVSKVMLMPLLALYFYHYSKDLKSYTFIYLALFFSWCGDIFLMFPRGESSPNVELLFICGLVSFLLGHLNYIVHFIKEVKIKPKVTILIEKPYLVLPFLLFIVVLLKILYPTLGTMKIPVTVYSIVIAGMVMAAFNRRNMVNRTSFFFVFIGALLFVFSDFCIAINVFYQPFELARIVIMTTYIMAQIMIVKGVLLAREDLN